MSKPRFDILVIYVAKKVGVSYNRIGQGIRYSD
jgi:hypothetical protein